MQHILNVGKKEFLIDLWDIKERKNYRKFRFYSTCFLYYIIEFIGVLLYMPVRIMLLLLRVLGINLYPVEKGVWDSLEKLDR
jgi:hypothetical protein